MSLLVSAAGNGGVTLVKDGKPSATIIIPVNATPTERLAGEELQYHIRLMSGAELPIRSSSAEGVRIFLGRSAKEVGVSAGDLELEYYRIKSGDDWLAVAGRDGSFSPRVEDPLAISVVQPGTLFGVYHLLDDVLGVRWLWPGESGTCAPRKSTIVIPDLDITDGPQLIQRHFRSLRSSKYRQTIIKTPGVSAMPEELASRLQKEELMWLRRHRMGRRKHFGFGHAFTRWWVKYHRTHPEFFAKLHKHKQPYPSKDTVKFCLSNPAVVEQIVKDWKASGAGQMLRACPNDSRAYCTCELCRQWDLPVKTTPENVDSSVLTYRYVRFWNALWEKASKINPNVWICGYAYSNYRKPPTELKLKGRVILGYVPETPWGGKKSKPAEEWLQWSNAGAKLFLRPNWFHCGHINPYLPLRDVGNFFRFIYKHDLKGTDFDSLLGHWSTQGPLYYLLARLHTHPERSVDEIIGEYCSGFGPARKAIRRYIDYWGQLTPNYRDLVREKSKELAGSSRAYIRLMPAFFTDTVLANAEKFLDKAERKAKDDERVKRMVGFLRLGLEHIRLVRQAVTFADGAVSQKGGKKPNDLVRAVAELRKFRQVYASEGFDWTEYSDYNEIRLGDFTGLRQTVALGGRAPLLTLPSVWGFQWDPDEVGIDEEWFREDFDIELEKWTEAQTLTFWEDQPVGRKWAEAHNGKQYDGVAWYRTTFDLPPHAKGKKITLLFGAVDEACKIWVNGKLAGEHPFINLDDWKIPFEVDITKAVRFGGRNTLVVRVEDRAGRGGIWKPVWVLAE